MNVAGFFVFCIIFCGSLNIAQGIDDALVEFLGAQQIGMPYVRPVSYRQCVLMLS